MNLGSGVNGEFTFLDCVSILSFFIGVENLGMNISQEDMQRSTEQLDRALRENVDLIHQHLEEQDKKLDEIMKWLGMRGENE